MVRHDQITTNSVVEKGMKIKYKLSEVIEPENYTITIFFYCKLQIKLQKKTTKIYLNKLGSSINNTGFQTIKYVQPIKVFLFSRFI